MTSPTGNRIPVYPGDVWGGGGAFAMVHPNHGYQPPSDATFGGSTVPSPLGQHSVFATDQQPTATEQPVLLRSIRDIAADMRETQTRIDQATDQKETEDPSLVLEKRIMAALFTELKEATTPVASISRAGNRKSTRSSRFFIAVTAVPQAAMDRRPRLLVSSKQCE